MITESDHVAIRNFVNTCEEGRGVVDRLWWMFGVSSGGEYVARVQLAGVHHTGQGQTPADAINALGEKLITLGVVARKR